MKPRCLTECSTCGILPVDHTPRQMQEHFGIEYLIEFYNERKTEQNKILIEGMLSYAMHREHEKMVDILFNMEWEIYKKWES